MASDVATRGRVLLSLPRRTPGFPFRPRMGGRLTLRRSPAPRMSSPRTKWTYCAVTCQYRWQKAERPPASGVGLERAEGCSEQLARLLEGVRRVQQHHAEGPPPAPDHADEARPRRIGEARLQPDRPAVVRQQQRVG